MLAIMSWLLKSNFAGLKKAYSSGQRHAAGQEVSRLGIASGHHAELVAGHEASEVLDLLLQRHLGVEVGLLVGVGGLVAGISVRETTVARHFGS